MAYLVPPSHICTPCKQLGISHSGRDCIFMKYFPLETDMPALIALVECYGNQRVLKAKIEIVYELAPHLMDNWIYNRLKVKELLKGDKGGVTEVLDRIDREVFDAWYTDFETRKKLAAAEANIAVLEQILDDSNREIELLKKKAFNVDVEITPEVKESHKFLLKKVEGRWRLFKKQVPPPEVVKIHLEESKARVEASIARLSKLLAAHKLSKARLEMLEMHYKGEAAISFANLAARAASGGIDFVSKWKNVSDKGKKKQDG